MNIQTLIELKNLAEKIAMELVFAESGKDLGLLPINSLLGQMEELAAGPGFPEALMLGIQQARRWLDQVFETTGTFSTRSLQQLGEWAVWSQEAATALETQSVPPPLPTHWQEAGFVAAPPTALVPDKPTTQEEVMLLLNLEEDGELLAEFINESQEHLENVEQGVLLLEENPSDADTLNSIFRAFHTFKGGSGFLNLTAIQTLAHELESLLELARQHRLPITPPIVNLILEGADTLKQFVREMSRQLASKKPAEPILIPTQRLLAKLRAILPGNAHPIVSPAAVSKPPEPALPTKAVAAFLPVILPTLTPIPGRPENGDLPKTGPTGTSVKVDTTKLDSLVDLVGEMVIAQSLVVQNRDLSSLHSEQLTRDMTHLSRISKDLQRTAMSLRMVPIRATFQKMNRLVRDVTAKVGKQVELVTEGEDTELDRTIVEEIGDPLIHMIRNSVDHGIEKPDLRLQRGKPAHGTVVLKAYHQGGNIVIEIKDDGNGLNRDVILAKAVEKGLVKPDEELSDSQVFNLILIAGFSTAEKVTDLSGRGVGMDVVRRNIEKLRGKIEIQSAPGLGSTFKIHLPLTMAIIDGLLVGVGEHRYIVPTLSVCESFRPTTEMISTVHERGEMINVRGRLRPLLRLYELLGLVPASTDPTQSIVVVVEAGANARCVLVDQLLGKQEVVIKSLGETFRGNRCISGAAILGDGRVGLILDPQALVNQDPAPLEVAA